MKYYHFCKYFFYLYGICCFCWYWLGRWGVIVIPILDTAQYVTWVVHAILAYHLARWETIRDKNNESMENLVRNLLDELDEERGIKRK